MEYFDVTIMWKALFLQGHILTKQKPSQTVFVWKSFGILCNTSDIQFFPMFRCHILTSMPYTMRDFLSLKGSMSMVWGDENPYLLIGYFVLFSAVLWSLSVSSRSYNNTLSYSLHLIPSQVFCCFSPQPPLVFKLNILGTSSAINAAGYIDFPSWLECPGYLHCKNTSGFVITLSASWIWCFF